MIAPHDNEPSDVESPVPLEPQIEIQKTETISEKKFNQSDRKDVEKKKVSVQYSGDSSDGPLSDIDDILCGNISDPEKHPMKEAIFSPENRFLPQVLERMNGTGDDKDVNQDVKVNDESKKEEVKKPRGKKKKDSPRKTLLRKKTAKKLVVPDQEDSEPVVKQRLKEKKTKTVRFLPLSERQIYHGRNWVPMTEVKEEESECSFDWINKFSELRVDEIADVNGNEKLLMSIWNRHLDKTAGAGRRHMDYIMLDFLIHHATKMIKFNIVRNFVSHLTSFHQAGAVKQVTVYKCLLILEQMTEKSDLASQFSLSWTQPRSSSVMNSSNISSSSSSASSSPSIGETESRASPTISRPLSSSLLSKVSP